MSRRYFNLNESKDVEEVINLLVADDDDPTMEDEFGEESDVASDDEVEERGENSETEQDDETDLDDENSGDIHFFLGKDKISKWNQNPPLRSARRGPHNIITHLPGVKGNARNASTAVDIWNNIFTDEILNIIVTYTNQYIETIRNNFSRERDIKPTDRIEIRAFIGLLYLAGAYRGNRQYLEELWGIDDDGIERFGLVMNIKRFKTLMRCLRFDDRSTREERKELDRLAPVRDIFEKFIRSCQDSYIPGENMTIDEMLPGFRGNCPFRQYIPSKPNKYGIKCFALVDAKMNYVYNMEIYAGRQPEGPFSISNRPRDVVLRMSEPLFGTGRNITGDNWFTDMDLVDELKQKNYPMLEP